MKMNKFLENILAMFLTLILTTATGLVVWIYLLDLHFENNCNFAVVCFSTWQYQWSSFFLFLIAYIVMLILFHALFVILSFITIKGIIDRLSAREDKGPDLKTL